MTTIRPERLHDVAAVRAVNEAAFGQATEAAIVDSIRAACPECVSLVATDMGQIVGHILLSPVSTSCESGSSPGMALGPMAVVPERQRQGIGSQLVQAAVAALRERSCPFIIVLGHPEYYPRFGFQPASQYGLACQWDGIPDNVFMRKKPANFEQIPL